MDALVIAIQAASVHLCERRNDEFCLDGGIVVVALATAVGRDHVVSLKSLVTKFGVIGMVLCTLPVDLSQCTPP